MTAVRPRLAGRGLGATDMNRCVAVREATGRFKLCAAGQVLRLWGGSGLKQSCADRLVQ